MAPNIAPQGPAGILASSQPLMQAAGQQGQFPPPAGQQGQSFVDSMTQDAVNPMGGGTLAMAEGGVAGFENGGLYNFPLYGGAVPDPQAMVPTSLSPSGQISVQRARTETDAERLIRQFPRRQAGGIPVIGKAPGETYGPDPSGLLGKAARQVPGRVGTGLEAAARAFGDIATEVDLFLGKQFRHDTDIYRWLFSDEEEISGRTFSQRRVLTDLISIQPERKDEILEVGAGLIGAGIGLDSAEQFAQEIAKSLSMRHEAAGVHKAAGVRELAEDEYGGYPASGIIMTDAEKEAAAEAPIAVAEAPAYDDEMEFYNQDLRQDIEGYRQATIDGEDKRMKFAQDLSARGVTQNYIDTVLQSAGDVGLGPTPDDTSAPSTEGSRRIDQPITPLIAPPRHKPTTEERGISIPVTNAGNPEKPPVMVRGSDLFKELIRRGPETDPDLTVAALDDVISRGIKKTGGDPSVDVGALKRDLESLLPAVEDDPGTEGLLLVMLGASIAGGESSNWLTNVKDGVEKSMPAIINYRAKKKSDKRAQQMAVAKMAITQKLSLEAEQRADSRTIRTEDRAAERDRLKTNQYITLRPTEISADQITEGADGIITIPKLMPFTLDSYGVKRLQGLRVPIIEVGKPTMKLEDILAGGFTTLNAKEINRDYTDPKTAPSAPFKSFGDDYSYRYMEPKYSAYVKAIQSNSPHPKAIINPNEAESLFRAYGRVSKNYGNMYKELIALNEIAQNNRLVGAGAIKEQIGSSLQGLAGARFLEGFGIKKFADMLLEGKDLSDRDSFTTKGRLLLAKMAPIILGESGRTISDADRIRVARSLGFEVDAGVDSNGEPIFRGITGFDSRILQNPNTVMAAITETAALVRDRFEKIHSIYAQEMARFDVNVPGLKSFLPDASRKKSPTLRFDLRKQA